MAYLIQFHEVLQLLDQLALERCSHCGIHRPNLTLRWHTPTTDHRGVSQGEWAVYQCANCSRLILARGDEFKGPVTRVFPLSHKETFEFEQLPSEVAEDFREALNCYTHGCWNAFAAMCRRTVQSVSTDLGAEGQNQVLRQIKDLRELVDLDEGTFDSLRQIIVSGHDGAHPHLPRLSHERAAVLLELMKDVLYQLYVRKKRVEKAVKLRRLAIEQAKQ